MKHSVRRSVVALLLAVALVASFAFAGAANFTEKTLNVKGGVEIYLDGEKLDPTDVNGDAVDAFIYNGTTYLPIRAISEAIGYDVDFDLGKGAAYVTSLATTEKADEYLSHFFGVEFGETVSVEAWNAAIASVDENAAAVEGEGEISAENAIVSAVKLAGLDELALSYTAEKAQATIEESGSPYTVESGANYYACALDSSLIAPTTDPTAALDGETATELLMGAVQTAGKGRNYIGRVSDSDIAAQVVTACNQIVDLEDDVLTKLGEDLFAAEIITGYGVKYEGYSANFLPEYTIQYGHSSTAHAVQLINLLKSEGIDGYIQIEPKTSSFTYGGNISSGNEYDLLIEFDTAEDRVAFDAIAKQYVQKFPENQNEDGSFDGLLTSAWWTPLYSSTEPVDEQYAEVCNNIIKHGSYEIQTFSTEEDAAKIAEFIETNGIEVEVTVSPRYANLAFAVDYLPTGDSVQ